VPLFLFHILEYMNVDFDLDIDEINERWEELASGDVWSQMILKETDDIVQRLTATPRTGQYSIDGSGALVFRRPALDWHQLQNESEAFFLRIYGPGDYRWKGADLGVLVTSAAGRLGRRQIGAGHPGTPPHRLDPRRIRRHADCRARGPADECRGEVSAELGARVVGQLTPTDSQARLQKAM
jgi:hypothetical protein